MAEEINKMLDEIIDDFRYTVNFVLDLVEELPAYFWRNEKKKKVESIKGFNKKYFEEK